VSAIFDCPTCKTRIKVPSKFLGRWISCPKCKSGFAAMPDEPEEPDTASTARPETPGDIYADMIRRGEESKRRLIRLGIILGLFFALLFAITSCLFLGGFVLSWLSMITP